MIVPFARTGLDAYEITGWSSFSFGAVVSTVKFHDFVVLAPRKPPVATISNVCLPSLSLRGR